MFAHPCFRLIIWKILLRTKNLENNHNQNKKDEDTGQAKSQNDKNNKYQDTSP